MTHSIVPAEASALLRSLRRGELTLIDGSVRRTFGKKSNQFPLEATITIHHPRFYPFLQLRSIWRQRRRQ
jgi:hypothetical protein